MVKNLFRIARWLIVLTGLWAGVVYAAVPAPRPPTIDAKAHVLIDFYTGKVLTGANIDAHVKPASLTKMMTIYVVDAELKAGRLRLDEKTTISPKAWQAEGSRMFVEVDTDVTIDDLIHGVIIQSGNDASIALAEHVAGSEESFVALMNQHAAALGMTNTHFENATGLNAENQYTSARDMARLGQALIRDFPESYPIYSQRWFTYNGIKQPNRNRLLWRNEHVDGIKTGHDEHDGAGWCLVASALKDSMRLVSVVMGAKDDNARTELNNKLLTYGFRFFETHKLFENHQSLKDAHVWMGIEESIALGTAHDVFVTIPQGQYANLKAVLKLDSAIKAPVHAGDPLGTLTVTLGDELLHEEPLIALNDVSSGSLWRRFSDYVNITVKKATGRQGTTL